MKIEKGLTPNFDQYEVYVKEETQRPLTWRERLWSERLPRFKKDVSERQLEGIISANEETGMVVQQVMRRVEDEDCPVFTNGVESLTITNTVKFLLTTSNLKDSFLAAGFEPKTTKTYYEKLVIKFKGPVDQPILKEAQIVEVAESEMA